jgi:hypothetical protein
VSEGSFWPKTWREAVPLAVWTVLIFAAGFETIAALVHGEWIPSIASFIIFIGLMALLLHWHQLKGWLTSINPNWIVAAVITALAAIILSPVVTPPQRTSSPTQPLSYRWAPLNEDEQLSLRISLKTAPKPGPFRVICLSSDCRDLANSFVSVFHGVGWDIGSEIAGLYTTPVGISLYLKDEHDHLLANLIEKATKGRLVVEVRKSDDPRFESLLIGVKP